MLVFPLRPRAKCFRIESHPGFRCALKYAPPSFSRKLEPSFGSRTVICFPPLFFCFYRRKTAGKSSDIFLFQAHHVDLTRVPLVPERRNPQIAKTEGEIEAVRRVVSGYFPICTVLTCKKRVAKLLRPLRCGKEHLADAAAVVFFQHAHDIEFPPYSSPFRQGKRKPTAFSPSNAAKEARLL